MQKKFSVAWYEEQAKRAHEIADWKDQVTAAAVVLAEQLPFLEGYSVPYNVAKPLGELQKMVGNKPLPLLKGDWED